MRITFDITSAVKPEPTGIGNYVVDLITAMYETAPSNHYSLGIRPKRFLRKDYVKGKFPNRAAFFPLVPPFYSLLAGRMDLFHALGVRLPKHGKFKKVVTIHDLNTIEVPHLTRKDWAESRGERIRETVQRADGIVTPSDFTKKRMLEQFRFPEEAIRTVYHGVDLHRYRPQSADVVQNYLKKIQVDRPYLLHIGAYVPRKNKILLVRAFAQSRARKDGLLLLAGSKRGNFPELAAEVERLGISSQVKYLGFIERDDIVPLLAGARTFCFPSFYEGFGLPVLEAMAVGTPVIAAHSSSLPEVGGDTVEYFDPHSVEDLQSGIDRLWEDERKQKSLSEKGQSRAREFTWARAARESLAFYKELLH